MTEFEDEAPAWIYTLPDSVKLLNLLVSVGLFAVAVALTVALSLLQAAHAGHHAHGSPTALLWALPIATLIVSLGALVFSFESTVFEDGMVERQSLFRAVTIEKEEIESYRLELKSGPTGYWLAYDIALKSGFQTTVLIDPRDRDAFLDQWFSPIPLTPSSNATLHADILARTGARAAANRAEPEADHVEGPMPAPLIVAAE